MTTPTQDDFTNGSAFFGFMGVSMALVLASTPLFIQIWEPRMERPKQELESAASRFGNLQWL